MRGAIHFANNMAVLSPSSQLPLPPETSNGIIIPAGNESTGIKVLTLQSVIFLFIYFSFKLFIYSTVLFVCFGLRLMKYCLNSAEQNGYREMENKKEEEF